MSVNGKKDPIAEIQTHLKAKNAAEAAIQKSMKKLDTLAKREVRKAFKRVF
jgi:hypothetical protein